MLKDFVSTLCYVYLYISIFWRNNDQIIVQTSLLRTNWKVTAETGLFPAPILPADQLVVADLLQLVALVTDHHRCPTCLVPHGVSSGQGPMGDTWLTAHHWLAAGSVSWGVTEPSAISGNININTEGLYAHCWMTVQRLVTLKENVQGSYYMDST